MKYKILVAIVISMTVSSCMVLTSSRVIYARMTKPVVSDSLLYQDNEIGVVFNFYWSEASFILQNKTNRSIKVIWDDMSFVKNGETSRVIHKGIKYINSDRNQVPTLIPPGASLNEFIIPSENAFYTSGQYGGWARLPLFYRVEDRAKVGILLPVEVLGEVREYYFTFDIFLVPSNAKVKYDTEGYQQ